MRLPALIQLGFSTDWSPCKVDALLFSALKAIEKI